MNDDQGFKLHPGAAQDISEIWRFIASDNPRAATAFRESLLETFHKLALFPQQGHRRPDLSSRPLRFHITGNYLIAYAGDQKPLVVVAVIHGRRSPRTIAATLRQRE